MTHQATGQALRAGLAVWLVSGLAMAQPAPDVPAPPASASPATTGVPATTGAASATVAPSAAVAAPSPTVVVLPVPSSTPPASAGGQAAVLVPWTPPPVATYTPVSVTTYTTAPGERSYGNHLAIVDVTALSLGVLAPITAGGSLIAGLGVYTLGGPIVHFAHGHVGRGFTSLGLRVGAPVAGGFALYSVSCPKRDRGGRSGEYGEGLSCVLGTGLGALLGIGVAIGIDYGFLAREKVPGTAVQTVSWAPTIQPSKDGMSLGMAGAW